MFDLKWPIVASASVLLLSVFFGDNTRVSPSNSAQAAVNSCHSNPVAMGNIMSLECDMLHPEWFMIRVDSTGGGSPQQVAWSLTCGKARVKRPTRVLTRVGVRQFPANSSVKSGPERAAYLLMSRTQKSCQLEVTIETVPAFTGGARGLLSWGDGWGSPGDVKGWTHSSTL